jgi:hypothetical protein
MISTKRVGCGVACLAALLSAAPPALAQYRPLPAPRSVSAPSDSYHVELGLVVLSPPIDAIITSSNFGIAGSAIDMGKDLGMTATGRYEIRLLLRPSKRQKLRLSYLPQSFTNQTTFKRDIIFNGIKFAQGSTAASTYQWTGWRFGYEYDFVSSDRVFAGLVIEAKYTDAQLEIKSATEREYIQAKAPLPAIGAIVRYYVMPTLSFTGELTGFGIPNTASKRYYAKYLDYDVYGTFYITDNVGVIGGYRSIDVRFKVDTDQVETRTKSPYIGGVIKF